MELETQSAEHATSEASDALRFPFGRNWQAFLGLVDDERIMDAMESLRNMLGVESLEGRSFLDAGCGSGLFSLAACRLGAARVLSFDYDSHSVACAATLRARHLPEESRWEIQSGDVTDEAYCDALGRFDVVYSWGVIHHTGAMWRAAENLGGCVEAGGSLYVAIYHDQGRLSRVWTAVKRFYNRAPGPLRPAIAAIAVLPRELRSLLVLTFTGRPWDYARGWRTSGRRGMSRWHNIVDWVGGYPFEVAKPEEVLDFYRVRGFELVALRTVGNAAACNEFVFRPARVEAPPRA